MDCQFGIRFPRSQKNNLGAIKVITAYVSTHIFAARLLTHVSTEVVQQLGPRYLYLGLAQTLQFRTRTTMYMSETGDQERLLRFSNQNGAVFLRSRNDIASLPRLPNKKLGPRQSYSSRLFDGLSNDGRVVVLSQTT